MSFLGDTNGIGPSVSSQVALGNFTGNYGLAPSLLLNFAASETLDPRITFTRSTTATRTNSSGLIASVAIDAPRFEYNPTTLASKGLLIEEQRTNLFVRSAEFENAAWSKNASSITANAAVAPDGATAGDKLVEDLATTGHFVSVGVTFTTGVAYTATVYAKAAERSVMQIILTSTAFGTNVIGAFDLSLGVATASGGTARSVSISAVGNGWYRCVLSAQATSNALSNVQFRLANTYSAAAPSSYTGNGTSGLFIWGAQLEVGAFATSYIPTVAAQITRTADVAVMTGTNFSSWYSATQGTLYAEFGFPYAYSTAASAAFNIDDGSANSELSIRTNQAHTAASYTASQSGTVLTNIDNATVSSVFANVFAKSALAFSSGNSIAAANSILGTNSTTVFSPGTMVSACLGNNRLSSQNLNGTIKQIAYYSNRLADAQLQTLTR